MTGGRPVDEIPVAERIRAEWERDGFAVVAGRLDPKTVEAGRRHLAGVAGRHPAGTSTLAVPLGADRFADSLAADPRLVALAGIVVGARPRCFGYTYLVKAPRTGPPALWHQDGYPWQKQWAITDAVTVWVPLDDVTSTNGALLVLPGTHRRPAAPLVAGHGWGPGLGLGETAGGRDGPPGGGGLFGAGVEPGPVDPREVRVLDMVTGDVSLHHPCLLHASGPNRSDAARRAIAIRYRAG